MEGNLIFAGLCLLSIILLLPFFTEGNIQDSYIGCYFDNVNDQPGLQKITLQNNTTLTIELCIGQCLLQSSTYARLKNSKECLCGNNFGGMLPDTFCNSLCPGNQSEYCGGSNGQRAFYSLYAVCEIGYYGSQCDQVCHCNRQAPCDRMTGECPNECEEKWSGTTCSDINLSEKDRPIGCFGDNETRAIPGVFYYDERMTVEMCTNRCILRNNSFVGLQAGGHCFCGETYAKYGPLDESICKDRCVGNTLQKCGGPWANSVYSVCPAGYYGPNCHNRCHCYNNSRCVYLTGECNSTCIAGWTGISCNIRDCMAEGGGCFQNETCANVDLNFATFTRCRCLPGYEKKAFWDICQDIDECGRGLCDASTTDCTNTIGSYNCTCKPGYKKYNATSCNDIDECALKIHNCSDATEECNNTFGSFFCICKIGFQRENHSCEDTNECNQSRPDGCDISTSMCTNTVGSFKCSCLEGYEQHIDTSCKRKNSSNPGEIAGAVIGSILGVALIAVIIFFVLRFYRRKRSKDPSVVSNAGEDAASASTSNLLRSGKRQVQSLYGEENKAFPASNALNTIRSKLSDHEKLEKEFQIVPLKTKDFSALGTREELKKKNRFMNIIPYDWNRVVLSKITDDDTSAYINASYIQGYNDSDKFIAAQGPRAESLEDFWRMILEKDIRLIVMITKLVENQKTKCEKYWPNTGQPVVYGDITVALKSEASWPDYTVRQIIATKNSQTVEIAQWHFMAWPDHGVPTDAKGFLEFRRKVRQHMLPDKYTLVHCSAGAGRTGTFIAIDYLLEQEKIELDVDVHSCLKQMRDQRSTMIQNFAQYEFVHTALLTAFSIGDTAIPVERFIAKYQFWQEKNKDSEKSVLEIQFENIEESKNDEEETAGHLVLSKSIQQSKMSDMDAVFVQSWKQKDAYIAMKLPESPNDFWNLRKEQKCLTIIFIDATQGSGSQFLPTKTNPIALKDSMILLDSETPEDYGTRCILTESTDADELYANAPQQTTGIYENTNTNSERIQLTVLHATETLTSRSGNTDPLFSLYNAVCGPNTSKTFVPVMIVTRTDCSLNGFVLAAFNAFDMIKHDKEVDVYQTVLNIRKSKTDLFNSMSSYVELHDAIERYIRMSTA